jgi:hypothetical protein
MQRQRPQGSKRPAPPLTGNTSRLAPLTPGVPETLQCNVATGNPRPIPARRSAAAPLHVVVPRSTCNVQPATPRAASPRAAAPLRPSTWSSHVQRATCNLQPRAPHPRAPQRRCAPPRGRPTFNVQRATCNPARRIPSRLSPRPARRIPARLAPPPRWPPLPVRAQRRCAPPRCRPTFNVQRATCNPARRIPSRLSPRPARRISSRLSPLASRLIPSPLAPHPLSPLASYPHTTGDRRIRITQRSSAVASVKV